MLLISKVRSGLRGRCCRCRGVRGRRWRVLRLLRADGRVHRAVSHLAARIALGAEIRALSRLARRHRRKLLLLLRELGRVVGLGILHLDVHIVDVVLLSRSLRGYS